MSRQEGGPPKNARPGKPDLKVVRDQVVELGEEAKDAAAAAKRAAKSAYKAADAAAAKVEQAAPMPHDQDAERRLVGSLLLRTELLDVLPPARDFYVPQLRAIVVAARAVREAGGRFDVDTILAEVNLREPLALKASLHDDPKWVEHLIDCGSMFGSVALDAERVRQLSTLRRQRELFESGTKMIMEGAAADPAGTLESVLFAVRDLDQARSDARRAIKDGSDPELARATLDVLRRGSEPIVYAASHFQRYDKGSGLWTKIDDDDLWRAAITLDGLEFAKGRKLILKGSRIQGVLLTARHIAGASRWFNDAPAGLCFTNGFVEVTPKGVQLREHSPANRCTVGLPYAYDVAAKAPKFEAFLARTFRGDADAAAKLLLLQEFTGICLVGRAADYARALILLGGGRNGKGVFLKVFRSLFPDDTVTTFPPSEFMGQQARRTIAAIDGKRLNYCGDLPSQALLETGVIKGVIAGDEMTGVAAYAPKPQQVFPVAGHAFAVNPPLPTASDTSTGWRERFFIVSFDQYIPPTERDPNLASDIIAEERPGIVAWALQGAVRLMERRRYLEPTSSNKLVDRWLTDSDNVRLFMEDKCALSEELTQSSVLFKAYMKYCEEGNLRAVSIKTFGQRLVAAGVTKSEGHDFNAYGLAVVR